MPTVTPSSDSPVLLYDGDCGFCAGSVQFILAREPVDRRSALRFAPLQGAFGTAVRAKFPVLNGLDSVIWYDPSQTPAVRVKSEAALASLAHLGGVWRVLATAGRLMPRAVRDVVYDAIAKRRLELAAPACLLPDTETRARFLP